MSSTFDSAWNYINVKWQLWLCLADQDFCYREKKGKLDRKRKGGRERGREVGRKERDKRKGTGFSSRPELVFVKLDDFFISTGLSYLICKLGIMLYHATMSIGNYLRKHSSYRSWNHQHFLSACYVLDIVLGAFHGFIQNNIMKLMKLLSPFLR